MKCCPSCGFVLSSGPQKRSYAPKEDRLCRICEKPITDRFRQARTCLKCANLEYPKARKKLEKLTSERAQKMYDLYVNGSATLQEIGDQYGLTRERVRQIIKPLGASYEVAGRKSKIEAEKLARLKTKEARREKSCQKRFGMSRNEFLRINGGESSHPGAPVRKFYSQKKSAKNRGIDWNLTFKEWWYIWQESGKWRQRGLGKGKYVMSRHLDQGAYTVGNVKIVTHEVNSTESYTFRYARGEPIGPKKHEAGSAKPVKMPNGFYSSFRGERFGPFKTVREARSAYLQAFNAHVSACKAKVESLGISS